MALLARILIEVSLQLQGKKVCQIIRQNTSLLIGIKY